MSVPAYIAAHKHSSNHLFEIKRSEKCGCFYCLQLFTPSRVQEWIDKGTTALCPYCHIDSVIGSDSGYPVTTEFLKMMKKHWFDGI